METVASPSAPVKPWPLLSRCSPRCKTGGQRRLGSICCARGSSTRGSSARAQQYMAHSAAA
eukprot:3320562-Prymnesium_polylepis.1